MHYAKAPLTEALIDIRVKLPGSIGLKDIEQAHKGEEKRYPTKAKQVSMTSHVEFSPDVGSSTHAKQTQTGLV